MIREFNVIGMYKEAYMGYSVEGSCCVFEYTPCTCYKYHLYLRDIKSNEKFDFCFWTTEGECGSGWCTATYGEIYIKRLKKDEAIQFNYRYNNDQKTVIADIEEDSESKGFFKVSDTADLEIFEIKDSDNNVIAFCNFYGFDFYYPSGSATVNDTFFIEIPRNNNNKRPVFIFNGESALYKSTLANNTSYNVYETDKSKELPEYIDEDIIVIGKRFEFTIEEVVKRIRDTENADVIICDFRRYGEN